MPNLKVHILSADPWESETRCSAPRARTVRMPGLRGVHAEGADTADPWPHDARRRRGHCGPLACRRRGMVRTPGLMKREKCGDTCVDTRNISTALEHRRRCCGGLECAGGLGTLGVSAARRPNGYTTAAAIDQCCHRTGAQVKHGGACGRVNKEVATSEHSWGSKAEASCQPYPGPCARVTTGEQLGLGGWGVRGHLPAFPVSRSCRHGCPGLRSR